MASPQIYSDINELRECSTTSTTSSPFSECYCDVSSTALQFSSASNESKDSLWILAQQRRSGVIELNRLQELGATETELVSAATAMSRKRPKCCQTFQRLPAY
jgi:hypothetical protein